MVPPSADSVTPADAPSAISTATVASIATSNSTKEEQDIDPPALTEEEAAATSITATAAVEEEEEQEEIVIQNLSVLPPASCKNLKPVAIPNVRPDEPVTSIRAALGELIGYAHITNYRLVCNTTSINNNGHNSDKINNNNSNRTTIDTTTVLDDYGDLSSLSDNTVISMELLPYKTVREHVLRLQHIFEGNIPVVKTLVDDATTTPEEENGKANGDAKKSDTGNPDGSKPPKSKQQSKKDKKNGGTSKTTASATGVATSSDHAISPITLDTTFFDSVTGEHLDHETTVQELVALEEAIHLSGRVVIISFLPPPTPRRRLMGDLQYLRIQILAEDNHIETTTTGEDNVYVTAIAAGFYRNKSTSTHLDPTPILRDAVVHHALLDCLLEASPYFKIQWNRALSAAQDRLAMTAGDSPLSSIHRVAVVAQSSSTRNTLLDAVVYRPTWMVPVNTSTTDAFQPHKHVPMPLQDDYPTFGLDLTTGIQRDWNEELQSAREMPIATVHERMERARVIQKVLLDFGDASYKAATAIHAGHISPMNPNEPTRSHVYLHNSIFISRAVDAGIETFKMSQGDGAAKKAASRDAQCMSFLHRMDASKLHTLATVLIDYLGVRYVCQSIVPGILSGEKAHTLMYGAVEATSPLAWHEEMHDLLEQTVGKTAMCATRVQPTQPLPEDRIVEIEALRTEPPVERTATREEPTTSICGPIEGKGIKGSDNRCYVLDLYRLTPRDANWVPKAMGGTGKWEEVFKNDPTIPADLEDDEWTTAVLRQELVTQLTHQNMSNYLKAKQTKEKESEDAAVADNKDSEKNEEETAVKDPSGEKKEEEQDEAEKNLPKKNKLTPEDEEYLASLRFNVNVFLPLRSLAGIDDDAVEQLKKDEERAREAALHLWDVLLPKVTYDMRSADRHQLPFDGKSMVELLHQHGINCRYLGRLAELAAQEEAKDRADIENVQAGRVKTIGRRVMPQSWLELLEVEMIARSAKHVLDAYLNEDGAQAIQVIASFLSALVSDAQETAGETEKRMAKSIGGHEEDEFTRLSLHGSAPIRTRKEVWDDIEKDIGRRFRYKITLYNCSKPSGRVAYPTLLRRVCQRTGTRLAAKHYALGSKCVCASEGRLTNSYPISPLDIVDVVPLMKHAGAMSGEGFVPCHTNGGLPSMHILFPDAKATFEAAHYHYNTRNLEPALLLSQEATSLYQRVVDGPLHLSVARCLDLTAGILFEANQFELAAAQASKALGLNVQLGGFDSAEVMQGHSTLSTILSQSKQPDASNKHLKAAAYLMELLAGPRYVELANCYFKLGTYYQDKDSALAQEYFQASKSKPHSDRLNEGMMAKAAALAYAKLEQYRFAVEAEKKAYQVYTMLLGEEHEVTQQSQQALQHFTKLAVEQGSKQVQQAKLQEEEAAADAMASLMEAEEAKEQKKKKNNKGKKKK